MTGFPNSFEALMASIAEATGLSPQSLVESARLDEDLGLDSFGRFQVITVVEDVGHIALPDELLPTLATLGDLYRSYTSNVDDR